ncbi:MAG: TonB-dependent receptor [Bacteroidetes bacterium]|jgi:iron complex outermembrane receptor protein|nr:TonB-dependent receptor [Bacteroidota bacterium]
MKRLFIHIFLVFLFLCGPLQSVQAQTSGTAEGTVLDAETSMPVAGANLFIPGLDRGASTDSDGRFVISSLSPGSYTLRVSFIGYETRQLELIISENETLRLTIELEPSQSVLEGIVVTSLRPDLKADLELEQSDIRKANPRDSGELLRSLNGVDAVRRGPIGLDPVIRGLRETEIGTYLDGTRIFPAGPARMDSPLSHLDPMMIESIEVVKGPYALNWGAGNMGAIRVQTQSLNSLQTGIAGKITSGYDSNFNTIENAVSLFGRSGNVGYVISGARRSGDNYESGNGTPIPGDYLSQEIRGKFDISTTQTSRLTLSAGYQNQQDIDYPGRLLDAEFFDTYNASALWEWTPENSPLQNLKARIYMNNVLHGMDNDQKPTAQPNPNRMPPFALDVEVDTKNYVYGGQLAATVSRDNRWEWEIGSDIYRSFRDATRTIARRDNGMQLFLDLMWPEATITDLGVYNRLNYSFSNRLSGTASIRVDLVSADADTISQFFAENVSTDLDHRETNLSASATLDYSLSNEWSIGLGAGTRSRTADASERYSDRIPASKAQTSAEFVGNPTLDPERSTQADLWIDARYPKTRFTLNGFVRSMDNYITLSPTDLPKRLPLSPETVFQYINGSAEFAGFDASLTNRFLEQWQVSGTLSYLWGEDTELDEPALGVSPFSGAIGLRYDVKNRPVYLEGQLEFVGSQERVASARGETSTDEYQVADLQGGWRISSSISLQAGIKNLFDVQYVNHLNAKNPFTAAPVPEPGRVIFGDLSIRF